MDFFYRQDRARRKTWMLLAWFVVAVLVIVLLVNAVLYGAWLLLLGYSELTSPAMQTAGASWLENKVWLYVTAVTVSVIAGGSLHRLFELSDGGVAVAKMVGAKPLRASSPDPADKTFINVVEEMAIASGMPVPQLFVLENESSINAFVAGYRPTEAVMVVTRGALEQLNRDELQGVAGHEFSHILNGDMRMNLRLLAILAGILLIGKIGQWLLRGAREGSGRGALFALLFGLMLFLVGYAGLFCGRMIKAAISRQREFLADASSVQFTRNTRGLASALHKIYESVSGSRLHSVYAEDLSHMCIGPAMSLSNWMDTHPPLAARIHAIDPAFMPTQRARKIIAQRKSAASAASAAAASLSASMGNISPVSMALAGEMYSAMPAELLNEVHTAEGAMRVIYALLEMTGLSPEMQPRVDVLASRISLLGKRLRLPLLDLALPQLKSMDESKRQAFVQSLEQGIKSDQRYTLNEFVFFSIIRQQLSSRSGQDDRILYHSFRPLQDELRILLSMMVLCSGQTAGKKQRAWQHAGTLFSTQGVAMLEQSASVNQISAALEKLRQTPMMLRKSFIEVCADLVLDDKIIMPAEAELLRAICESIDCPMPLLSAV